ncbi:chemotaxis protein CheZ [Aestuariispira insulae]|uniref:Chemotaxis protein CheZ n=2 Tax=Aestuariispira insulae TaxID=1461337 RepID=A0A3D9HPX4_9PROT|nr:chemotaxis protein CheZ [Aestuariispira insulae]
MQKMQAKKTFRIEKNLKQMLRQADNIQPGSGDAYDDERAEERHQELMSAINKLRDELSKGAVLESTKPAEAVDKEVVEDYKQQVIEATNLRRDLQELSEAIEKTKQEIAMLGTENESDDKLNSASIELSAVVQDTEAATDNIIAAAEKIEGLGDTIRNHTDDPEEHATLDELSEQIVQIFEACNFQDITGQRITKVVNTMKFIDDRIKRMMDIWGGSELFKGLVEAEEVVEDGEVMHGPALPDERISQADIDALFD